MGEKDTIPTEAIANVTSTLNFITNSDIEVTSNSIKIIGTDTTKNSYSNRSTYIYNNNDGRIKIFIDKETVNGTVIKNKFSITSGLQTIVFLKK